MIGTVQKGYVQDIVLNENIDLENAQVYACGSNDMINSAKEVFFNKNLNENRLSFLMHLFKLINKT